jgi:CheY-like chemotaxis protein
MKSRRANTSALARSGKEKARKLVMVVDDNEDGREMYSEYLAFHGYQVTMAANGQQAVEKARARVPDIILMDLSMPGLDGLEATRRLRALEQLRGVPVVALSGHVLGEFHGRAMAFGFDEFLPKPCLPDDLLRFIRRMLREAKRPTAASAAEAQD